MVETRGESGGLVGWAIQPKVIIPIAIVVVTMFVLFWDGLTYMVTWWENKEEYNHAYLIPPVAFYLLWLRAHKLEGVTFNGAWAGLLVVAMGLAGLVLGELSAIYAIIQFAFVFTLFGVVIAALGWRGFAIIWVPFVYLLFMVPLPEFIRVGISGELQVISSELGVAIIRLFGLSVFLEGNVIDLGIYQLQVAEACNGLRYLFPLLSFGFLCAVLYQGPVWHRVVLVLSTIPITILMNSFRIGVIGVLVNAYGIEQAEGFLHLFEGWVVFMVCVGLLFLEMWLLNRSRPDHQPLLQVFGLDFPPVSDLRALVPRSVNVQFLGVAGMLIAALLGMSMLEDRAEMVPERQRLAQFPNSLGEWRGQDVPVDQVYIDALKVDDHLMAYYRQEGRAMPVELWIAYYDTQRKGESVHSPRSCLPGGGWKMQDFGPKTIENVGPGNESLVVNRTIIAKGEARQLVYYWFEQRGRKLTNEYLVKWFIFWDSMTENRTDGALVRLATQVPDGVDIEVADQQLQAFIRAINPSLAYYLPQQSATMVEGSAQAAL